METNSSGNEDTIFNYTILLRIVFILTVIFAIMLVVGSEVFHLEDNIYKIVPDFLALFGAISIVVSPPIEKVYAKMFYVFGNPGNYLLQYFIEFWLSFCIAAVLVNWGFNGIFSNLISALCLLIQIFLNKRIRSQKEKQNENGK